MSCPNGAGDSARRSDGPAGAGRLARPLRCVWTGYPANGCSCHARIPGDVVTDAWRKELEADGNVDRYFEFVWLGGQWLAYGLSNGTVRGVCCPLHSAERAARARAADSYLSELAGEFAPAG